MNDVSIQAHVNARAWKVLEKARRHCARVLDKVRTVCDNFVASHRLTPADVCCVVVGSVGRQEGAHDMVCSQAARR